MDTLSRGRQLRTKVREAKAIARAKLEGERQFYQTQKGSIHWIKEQAVKLFSKDPIKITAFMATVYLTYRAIELSEEIAKKIVEVATTPFLIPRLELFIPLQLARMLMEKEEVEIKTPFWIKLCLAVVIAYMIVEHGADIVKGFGGIAQMGLFMLG